MTYNYYETDRIGAVSIADNLYFAFKKMRKLYPLYILTTLASIVFLFVGAGRVSIRMFLLELLMNILLVQEYIPLYVRSINGVTWYLCVMSLAYFIFPWLNMLMQRCWTRRRALVAILVSIIAMIMIGHVGATLPNSVFDAVNNPDPIWYYDMTYWFTHNFPLSRIWEFIIGCNLGYIFLNSHHDLNIRIYSVFEIGAIIATLIVIFIEWNTSPADAMGKGLVIPYPQLWWRNALVFLVSSIPTVYIYAVGRGVITRHLTNSAMLYIAEISPYGFLIHYVVFRYMGGAWEVLQLPMSYLPLAKISIGMIATIMCCRIWMQIEKRLSSVRMRYLDNT